MHLDNTLIMNSMQASPDGTPRGWITEFMSNWHKYVEHTCHVRLYNPEDANDALGEVMLLVCTLLQYVDRLHGHWKEKRDPELAIESMSNFLIPCIERQPRRKEELRAGEKKQRRDKLVEAFEKFELLGLDDSEYKNETDEHRLLRAILGTRYDSSDSVKAFMYCFTWDQCTKQYRRFRRYRSNQPAALEPLTRPAEDPVHQLNEKMDVEDASRNLPESQQKVFWLLIQGESDKEAAAILGVSYVAFRQKKSRMVKSLKKQFGCEI